MNARLREELRRRADGRCEYCHFPERWAELRFQADHVVAAQHGGTATLGNLAWACLRCNKHKGPNLAGVDPQTRQTVRLFNPRADAWAEHFAWEGARLTGHTPRGRATLRVLQVNHPDAVLTRQALMEEGEFFGEGQGAK